MAWIEIAVFEAFSIMDSLGCLLVEHIMHLLRNLLLLFSLVGGTLTAQELQTRVYHIPPDFAGSYSDGETFDPFTHPLPPVSGKDDSQKVLEAADISFPAGANCRFDAITELLTIHNTPANLQLVERYIEELVKIHPRTLRWHLSIVEADNGGISTDADAASQLAELRKASTRPDSGIRWLAESLVEGKGGTRVTHEAITEHAFMPPPTWSKQGSDWGPSDSRPRGVRLEVEGTISPDGQRVEANLAVHAPVPPPQDKTIQASNAEYPVLDVQEANWVTGVTFAAGETKLLGITASPSGSGRQVAAFLRCEVLDYDQSGLFSLFEGPPADVKPPPGMTAVTLHMPSGAYSSALPGRGHDSLLTWLETSALKPPGSRAQLVGDRLHLINTTENIHRIALVAHHLQQRLSKNVRVMIHTIQSAPDMLQSTASLDDEALYAHLEKEVEQGKAQFIDARVFEASGGNRVTSHAADEHTILTELDSDAEGNPWPSLDRRSSGSLLEFEVTVGPDLQHIEVSLQHERHPKPPLYRRTGFLDSKTQIRAEVPLADFSLCRTNTGITLQNGRWRLLSIQPLHGEANPGAHGFTFVRADLVLQHVPPRLRVPEPLPQAPPASADPDALEVRFYRVPPDFLSISGDKQKTAKDLLEEQGIHFPKGSSAIFIPTSSQLVVRNTCANLELVDIWTGVLGCGNTPRSVVITSQLVEAPGPVLRQLALEAAKRGNHESLFTSLIAMPEVKKLDLSRVEGKGGTRFTITSGNEVSYLHDFEPDEQKMPQIVQRKRHVGLRLEFEPQIDPELQFIQLNLHGEWHSSPPSQLAEHLIDALGRRFNLPLTVFHTHTFTSSFVMGDGTTHLVSLWKPSGAEQDVLQALFITVRIVP